MPRRVETLYHGGIVELKHKPFDIRKARVLVILPDAEEAPKRKAVDLGKLITQHMQFVLVMLVPQFHI
jgi:hypothetical protein